MSDVDIVAAGREAVDRIVCYDALSTQWNGRRDSDIVSELCDQVERLRKELAQAKADIAHTYQDNFYYTGEEYRK